MLIMVRKELGWLWLLQVLVSINSLDVWIFSYEINIVLEVEI
jgi:hypothetical protein